MPVEVGQVIQIKIPMEKKFKKEKLTVTQIYPSFVLAVDRYGFRHGLSLGDLVINKIIASGERLK